MLLPLHHWASWGLPIDDPLPDRPRIRGRGERPDSAPRIAPTTAVSHRQASKARGLLGYAHVSTSEQNLDLRAAGYKVRVTATPGEPPHLPQCYRGVHQIDILLPVVAYQQEALSRAETTPSPSRTCPSTS